MSNSLRVCEVGSGGGFFLPLFGDDEQDWETWIRIILYGLGLGWCFMGVALVSDVFMGAIECITAQKTRKYNVTLGRWYTADVWNPTVANLTLMALGSSAPEILLSVIELFGNSFFSGDLGPSTIVGSAAFNLLMIISVCVSSIPSGEYRRIKEMPVYAVTACFSIFAYLWLLVILLGTSKNVVEPWEGMVTFLFFPMLVTLAWLADKGYFSRGQGQVRLGTPVVISAEMSKEELAELDARIRKEFGPELTSEQVSKIALIESNQTKSRAAYRVAATRAITGSKRVHVTDTAEIAKEFDGQLGEKIRQTRNSRTSFHTNVKVHPEDDLPPIEEEKVKAVIEFAVPSYAALESTGSIQCTVVRHGNLRIACSVKYQTKDGMAKAGEDYEHIQGILEFAPNEDKKTIDVTIVDDVAYEDDEEFYIELSDPQFVETPEDANDFMPEVEIGDNNSATIVIIDDDHPGVIGFNGETMHVPEDVADREVEISVVRKNGCSGKVTVKYHTENNGAIAGTDFDALEGTLTFENNEKEAKLKVNIKARGRYERTEDFRLVLTDVTGGARFDAETDGGADRAYLTIFIESDKAAKDRVDRLLSALHVNWDKAKVGHANWADQFWSALYVNGGDDDEEDGDADGAAEGDDKGGGGGASIMDWIMHIITLPWKLLFAFVPPTDYCHGWLCFVCSLLMIGLVTAVIGDMAALFGCVLTLPDEVTAITFVALGTSLPDTFASMAAAKQDAWADASIGNVTGSNSVNVFLGLGLPWMIGAVYWRSGTPNEKWVSKYAMDLDIPASFRDGAFVVKAGTLAFSVAVFCSCAATCLVVLYVRRLTCYGELGGPNTSKYITSACLGGLWLIYVALSSWKSLSERD